MLTKSPGRAAGQPESHSPQSSSRAERDLVYWKSKLDGAPILLEIPPDHPRSLTRSVGIGCVTYEIPLKTRAELQGLCQRNGANLTTGLLAAFQILLSRHTGCTDVVLGTRTVGRVNGFEAAIGCFSNVVTLRGDLSGDPCFAEYVRQIRDTLTECLEHQELPFSEIVEAILPEPPRGHAPLVQFLFTVRQHPLAISEAGGVRIRELEWPLEHSGFDLSVWADVTPEALVISADYRQDLFDRETVEQLLRRFHILLGAILESPTQPVSLLPMLTEAERQQVLVEWNRSQREYPSASTYSACFECTVQRMPLAIAACAAGREISYVELNRSANQLAHYLQNLGVTAETLVGVCLDRSLELATALLAVLKAGGAFMPLDPAYPKQRLGLMIEDAKPLLILSEARHHSKIPSSLAPTVCLDTDSVRLSIESCPSDLSPQNPATADSLAYVIYTSGSTGKPNGVEIAQRAMVNHSYAVAEIYQLSPSDRVLQFAALSFDIAVEEIFPSWLQGCAVVFRSEAAVSSTQRFFEFLEQQRISLINIPTAFWHQITDDLGTCVFPGAVTRVVIGGEQASSSKWRSWRARMGRGVKCFNAYGPTEATVTSTVLDCEEAHDAGSLSIGRPVANTRVYVLDKHRQAVGVGVAGELYIAGDCLARGYRGDPALTAERFVPDPYQQLPGARMYRTGDLVRWTSKGTLEFLGRADSQLKIRGYRIEAGEVEAVLGQHPEVISCVVVGEDRAEGGKQLVAYLVARSSHTLSVGGLRQWLAERLVDYLIPSRFILIPSLPLTPAGKVDRRILSRSRGQELASGTLYAPPTNAVERELVELWQRVLGKQQVGIDDHFFDLGGNSLLAAQMFAHLETAWAKRLPLSMLLEAPAIREIARKILDSEWTPSWSCLVPFQTHGKGQPLILVHGIKGNILCFQSLARELGVDRPVYGLQAQGLDGTQPAIGTIEEMANLYVRLITAAVPRGPYHIVGLSFGGLVAYEMAQQLGAMGRPVGVLGILDAFPNGHDRHLNWTERSRYFWELLIARAQAQVSVYATEGLKGTLEVLQSRWDASKSDVRLLWYRLISSNRSRSNRAVEQPSDVIEMVSLFACKKYAVCPYPGKVTLFIAAENAPSIKQLLRSAWKPLPVEGIEVHESPGDHNTMIDPPHVRTLAIKLRACLQAFEEL